jgi:hypothetical protein
MKAAAKKQLILIFSILVASLVYFGMHPSLPAQAATSSDCLRGLVQCPYFKAFGSDVFSGGWFNNGNACNTSPNSPYQDPFFTAAGFTADNRVGGIQAYAKQNGSGNPTGWATTGEVTSRAASGSRTAFRIITPQNSLARHRPI